MLRFDPMALHLVALISVAHCGAPAGIIGEPTEEPSRTLEFAVEGADVSERSTVLFNATSQELSADGSHVSLGMGYSLCDVDTETSEPTRDYAPEQNETISVLDVDFDGETVADQIVIEGGEIGIYDSGADSVIGLGVGGEALAAGWMGDDVVYLSGGAESCALTSITRESWELPSSACGVAQMAIDEATGTVFVAAEDRIAVVTDEILVLDIAADSLVWDADLGVLYTQAGDTVAALVEVDGGWAPQWSATAEDVVDIDRIAGGLVILREAGEQSIVEVRTALSGAVVSTVTAEGSFETVAGAADAPIFSLAGYTTNVHVMELAETLR